MERRVQRPTAVGVDSRSLPGLRQTGRVSAPSARFPVRMTLVLAVLLAGIIGVGTVVEDAQGSPNVVGSAGSFGRYALVATCDGHPAVAPREVRGMWLTTVYNIDWPSKPGLDEQT